MKIFYNVEYADGIGSTEWNQDYIEVKKSEDDYSNEIVEHLLVLEKDEVGSVLNKLNKKWPALPHRAVPIIVSEWLADEINETE